MSQRKTIFLDALKATNNSNLILLIIGVFWFDGKYSKVKVGLKEVYNWIILMVIFGVGCIII